MSQLNLKQLLEAGVHFGHQTQRWNPKMKKYIFGERNGIYIINLELTLACLKTALEFIKGVAAKGQKVLFVGTKKQAQAQVLEAADQCGMPYVKDRWLGGMLTNFNTVRKSIDRLDAIDRMEKDGSFAYVTKKEVGSLRKEREKLVKYLTGIRSLKDLPGAVFVIDSKKEEIAVREAVKLGIPVVAVLDTNCDPSLVNYPVPGNDDAIRAIKLFCNAVAQASQEGRALYEQNLSAQNAPADPESKPDVLVAVEAALSDALISPEAEEIILESEVALKKAGIGEEDEERLLKSAEDERKASAVRKPVKS